MTISRKQKRLKRILNSITEKVELSKNTGPLIHNRYKLTKKQRRHSGWKTPKISLEMKYSEVLEGAFEPQIFWDDWEDCRDGWRHNRDRTHFFKKWKSCCLDVEEVYEINKKIKKQRKIRKARTFTLVVNNQQQIY